MAIFIAAHKQFPYHETEGYVPLHVGAANGKTLPYTADNTGDNISAKNLNFCELTGVYWIWKNNTDDIKGLVHYRRYFTGKNGILSLEEAENLLKEYDIILAKTEYLRENAHDEFALHSGHSHDLDLLRQAVSKIDESYLPAYDKIFAGNRLHLYNMMVSSREIFDEYCEWLFAVLFELEKHVNMEGYTPYQQRLYGFLSERLLNVFVEHKKLKVKQLRVKNTEQTFKNAVKLFLRRQKNRIIFALNK